MVIKSVDAGAQLPGFKPCRSVILGNFLAEKSVSVPASVQHVGWVEMC